MPAAVKRLPADYGTLQGWLPVSAGTNRTVTKSFESIMNAVCLIIAARREESQILGHVYYRQQNRHLPFERKTETKQCMLCEGNEGFTTNM